MKKLKYIFLSLVLISFVACDDALELEPEQSLSTDAAFADEKTSLASLVGVYSLAQDLEVFGGLSAVISELQADNMNFVGSFPTLQDVKNYVTLADNGSVRTLWQDNYSVILGANAIIQNVPKVEDVGFTDAERKQFIGEAKFMRALVYFNLVNLFGQPFNVSNGNTPGVPLVLTPDLLDGKPAAKPARNTVAEVYAQIEKDLTEALADVPNNYATADQTRGRATKGAVNGLLSRLYLYKGDWAKVLTTTDAILANKTLYNLAADYTFYDGNTTEDVFSIQMTATDNSRTGTGGWAGYHLPAARGGRGDAPYSADLLAAYNQTTDKRFTALTLKGTDAASGAATFTTKFKDGVTNTDNGPIIRVTEIVLNRAEALMKSTNTVNADAILLLNQLILRAGLPAVSAADFADANAFLNRILLERRKELAFEGHRRMDLLRNGLPLRSSGPQAAISKPGDSKVVLPIPQRDIDLGASLPQNAGY